MMRWTGALAIALVVSAPDTAFAGGPRDYEGPRAVASRKAAPRLGVKQGPEPTIDAPQPSPPRPRVPSAMASELRPGPGVEPRTEVRLRLGLDLAITVGAAAPWVALRLWVEPSLPTSVPGPGSDPDVGRFDAVALGRYEEAPDIASDVLLAVSIAAPYGYHAIEAAVQRRGYAPVRGRGFFARYATDLVLLTQAIAINGFITEVLKASFRRPRPYTYLLPEEVDPDRREDLLRAQSSHGADWSFPSGHASSAFAASTAGATLLTLELLGRANWAIALAWVGGTGVAATTGVMRVLAGRHFPSDVVTSALIGAGIGAAVPLAHWRPPPAGDRVDVRDILQSWAVAPMGRRDMVGLHLGGPLP